jgi:TetR/AcrR family transcriptional repressor of nem operon
VFTAGLKTTLALVMDGLSNPSAERQGKALELMALLAGAVSMARATNDQKLSSEIIAAARKRANALLESRR